MFVFGSQDKAFCDLFERSAANVHQASLELLELLSQFDHLEARTRSIKKLESAGDQLTHEVIEKLHRTFVTSFDRDDVRALMGRLDDILDQIDEAANRVFLYKVTYPPDKARALAQSLRAAVAILIETIPLLRNPKNSKAILQGCRDIAVREQEADRVFERALTELFEESKDPTHVIKWKDIYDDLETACNHCRHAAGVIEAIVLKSQ